MCRRRIAWRWPLNHPRRQQSLRFEPEAEAPMKPAPADLEPLALYIHNIYRLNYINGFDGLQLTISLPAAMDHGRGCGPSSPLAGPPDARRDPDICRPPLSGRRAGPIFCARQAKLSARILRYRFQPALPIRPSAPVRSMPCITFRSAAIPTAYLSLGGRNAPASLGLEQRGPRSQSAASKHLRPLAADRRCLSACQSPCRALSAARTL